MVAEVELHSWAPDWMADANCTQAPWLFETEHFRDSAKKVRRARRLCATCPVRRECLLWALTRSFRVVIRGDEVLHRAGTAGILAGTTPSERQAVAHMPLEEQARTLEREFHRKATQGLWAVVREDEWI